jgi:hypothetical protein
VRLDLIPCCIGHLTSPAPGKGARSHASAVIANSKLC